MTWDAVVVRTMQSIRDHCWILAAILLSMGMYNADNLLGHKSSHLQENCQKVGKKQRKKEGRKEGRKKERQKDRKKERNHDNLVIRD